MTNKKFRQQGGFALATTLIILAVSLVSTTTMIIVLHRSIRLTRSHSDAIKAFYTSEAGKSFAMWKLSPFNDSGDKESLINCLAQNEACPGGLDATWNYTLPSDSDSTFTTSISSAGQSRGSAKISSFGELQAGHWLARRRTMIDAYKPLRVLEDNDQVFNYGIFTDEDIWTVLNGYFKVTTKEGEPLQAGIHANDDIGQFLFGKIEVAGKADAADVIDMPRAISTNTFTAEQYRGNSCGWSGCSSRYSEYPKYCFGTNCEGYVGVIGMPGFDINSAQPDSLKTIAREFEDQYPGEQFVYNAQEIESALEEARTTGANDGWVELPGPITYVDGALNIGYQHKLLVHGVLVVQGKLSIGIPSNLPPFWCLFHSCTATTELVIDDQVDLQYGLGAVTGLVATNDISFALYLKNFQLNGLIYTLKDISFNCLYNQITTQGAIVARNYENSDGICFLFFPGEPIHHHIYDTSKLHLLVQGPRSITDLTTVYSGHWEEEY